MQETMDEYEYRLFNVMIYPYIAKSFFELGLEKCSLGEYQLAIENYSKALKIDPSYTSAWDNRGFAKRELKQYKSAIEDFNQALKLSPKNAFALFNRGLAKKELGRYESAIEDYSEALKIDPSYTSAWDNRGFAKRELKQYKSAIEDFNQALKLSPKNAFALFNRGLAKKELGRYESAIEDYSEALKIDPSYASAWDNRGFAKRELKQYKSAIEDFNQALKLSPKNAFALFNRGLAKKELGQYESAIEDYIEALKLEPKNTNIIKERKIALKKDHNKKIHYDELKLGKELGSGGFGVVFHAKWNFQDVAVKQLKNNKLNKNQLEDFKKEVDILMKLNDEHVVRFFGVVVEETHHAMVMEFCKKGSLHDVIHDKNDPLLWPLREKIATGTANGLFYLDAQKIVHRDIKSQNILLDKNYTPKIGDFGLSKTKNNSGYISNTLAGTIVYMAPEFFQKSKSEIEYSSKTDIYAFGMVLWELSARSTPYKELCGLDIQMIMVKKIQNQHDKIPQETPQKIAHLIKWCWDSSPKKRPTPEEAVKYLTPN